MEKFALISVEFGKVVLNKDIDSFWCGVRGCNARYTVLLAKLPDLDLQSIYSVAKQVVAKALIRGTKPDKEYGITVYKKLPTFTIKSIDISEDRNALLARLQSTLDPSYGKISAIGCSGQTYKGWVKSGPDFYDLDKIAHG